MTQSWILGVGLLSILFLAYGVRNKMVDYIPPSSKYKIWWVIDNSQLNSRHWLDWGARTTFEPNEPYLKICQKKAIAMAGDLYDIEPVIGRVEAHRILEAAGCVVPPEADRCPPFLWLAWTRAAFLTHLGGLWLDGSVLPIASSATLQSRLGSDVTAFGNAGWSRSSHHPVWSGLERDCRALIKAGDQSWSSADCRKSLNYAWDRHAVGSIHVDKEAEVRIELETLLGETEWTGSTKHLLWIPFPDGRDSLERSTPWLWFLRMSEKQIQESNFVWASIAKKG